MKKNLRLSPRAQNQTQNPKILEWCPTISMKLGGHYVWDTKHMWPQQAKVNRCNLLNVKSFHI